MPQITLGAPGDPKSLRSLADASQMPPLGTPSLSDPLQMPPRTPGTQDPRTPGPQDPGPQDPRTQYPRTPGPRTPGSRTPGPQDPGPPDPRPTAPPHPGPQPAVTENTVPVVFLVCIQASWVSPSPCLATTPATPSSTAAQPPMAAALAQPQWL